VPATAQTVAPTVLHKEEWCWVGHLGGAGAGSGTCWCWVEHYRGAGAGLVTEGVLVLGRAPGGC